MNKPPGIVNFWSQEEPEALKRKDPKTPEPWRFDGFAMVIEIMVLRGKSDTDEDLAEQAKTRLGRLLQALPPKDLDVQLERQRIYRTPPITSKVTFTFPGTPLLLYAEASSTDPSTALRRATDRLALAVSYIPNVKEILAKHDVAIRRKV